MIIHIHTHIHIYSQSQALSITKETNYHGKVLDWCLKIKLIKTNGSIIVMDRLQVMLFFLLRQEYEMQHIAKLYPLDSISDYFPQ